MKAKGSNISPDHAVAPGLAGLLEDPSPIDDVINYHLHRSTKEAELLGGETQDRESASDDVDVVIGRKLRVQRRLMGLSQRQLADRIGVKLEQLESYERAEDRMGAATLWRAARALNCDFGEFFEGPAPQAD